MTRLFPNDIGFELEEQGTIIKFLTAIFDLRNSYHPYIFPHIPNIEYALGFAEHQKVAKLGLFQNSTVSSYT